MEQFSLLWPTGKKTGPFDFSDCMEDLELGRLSSLLFSGMPMEEGVSLASEMITSDPAVIAWRGDVLDDLMRGPALTQALCQVRDMSLRLKTHTAGIHANARGLVATAAPLEGFKKTVTNLEKLLRKGGNMLLDELDPDDYYAQFVRAVLFFYEHTKEYTGAMRLLKSALTEADLRAPALLALRDWVLTQYEEDKIEDSLRQLEQTDSWWTGISGFALDVCLDQGMNLESLEMSEIRSVPYQKAGMLDRLAEEGFDGLTAVMAFPRTPNSVQYQEYLLCELGKQARPELTRLRKEIIRIPVAGRETVIALGDELTFYTSAVRFCHRLREAGMPVVRPVQASEDKALEAEDLYMPELALSGAAGAVTNPASLGRGGYVNLVTGANSSGKTTWLIAVGQLQWLYQLGCYVPASRAAMRPVDALYTLFAAGESDTSEDSRMGLEVERIAAFTAAMTPNSLVLLNEPMTSTSASEGIEIILDLLTNLIDSSVSGMVVTHYNEVYRLLSDRLAASGRRDRLRSLVMEVERGEDASIRYPYRIKESPPGASSYARAIVARLGLELDTMLNKMSRAGMDTRPEDAAWAAIRGAEREEA